MFSEGQGRVSHGCMLCSSCWDSGCLLPQLHLLQLCNTSYGFRPLELSCFSISREWDSIVEDSWNCSTWALSTLGTRQPARHPRCAPSEHTHREMGLFPCPCLSEEPYICNLTYGTEIASLTYLRHSLFLLFYMSGFLISLWCTKPGNWICWKNPFLCFIFQLDISQTLDQQNPGSGNEQVIWASVEST